MKILALDTSSDVATCAIIDEDKLIAEYILNTKKTHSQKIMPMIKELFDNLEIDLKDIDVYAASLGPGSFTGLRIGLATLKSLAHVNDKPVVGIPTIDALAYNVPFVEGIIVPMMDARRSRVYTGIYKWNNDKLEVLRKQDVLNIDELLDILKEKNEKVVFSGNGANLYKDKIKDILKDNALFTPVHSNMPRASAVACLAMEKAKNDNMESYFELIPDYLRKSQAEREYDERTKNNG